MRKWCILMAMLFSLSACIAAPTPLSQLPPEPNTEQPTNWEDVVGIDPQGNPHSVEFVLREYDTNYVTLPDINGEAVSQLKMDIDYPLLAETPTGFIGVAGVPGYWQVSITEYDILGNVLWNKLHTVPPKHTLHQLFPLREGFCYFIYGWEQDGGRDLVMCNEQGEELWRLSLPVETLRVFQLESGLLVAGAGRDGNLFVGKVNSRGKLTSSKVLGGTSNDTFSDTLSGIHYQSGLGLIITGRKQSTGGDFVGVGQGQEFVACIDENLNLVWTHAVANHETLSEEILIADDAIYVPGSTLGGESTKGFLLKLDFQGGRVWKQEALSTGFGPQSIAALDSRLILGAGGRNEGLILVLNQDGEVLDRWELMFAPHSLQATVDGGFMVLSRRDVKPIPQPKILNDIWLDTEVLVAKYTAELELEWRKTYNLYPDERRVEYVWLLTNGTIVLP